MAQLLDLEKFRKRKAEEKKAFIEQAFPELEEELEELNSLSGFISHDLLSSVLAHQIAAQLEDMANENKSDWKTITTFIPIPPNDKNDD